MATNVAKGLVKLSPTAARKRQEVLNDLHQAIMENEVEFTNPNWKDVLNKPRTRSRLLNKLGDKISIDAIIEAVNDHKGSNPDNDNREELRQFMESLIDLEVFLNPMDFERWLTGKGAARVANAYVEGKLTDEQVIDKIAANVSQKILKDQNAFIPVF